MPNSTRRNAIARRLARHPRLVDDKGRYLGCGCGAVSSRLDHYKHLAELVEGLIEEAVDAAIGDHARHRNTPRGKTA